MLSAIGGRFEAFLPFDARPWVKLAIATQKLDWTEGCIAVTNDEMDEIMDAVKLGIPIEIVE